MSQYFFNVDYSVKVDFADASAPNGVVTASFLYGMVDLYGDMVYDGIGYEDDHEYVYNGKYFRYFTPTRGLYKNGVCINDRDSGDAYGIASNAKGGIRLHMFDDKRRSNSAGSDKLTYYLAGKNAGINTFLFGVAIDIFAYDVIFDGNGADSGSMANMGCVYGRGYFLPENKFSKQYYEFAGWNTKADGSGDSYWTGSFVSNLTSTDKSVTLYAQWKKATYTITYNLNGGKNNSKNPASYTVTTSDIKLQNPSRTGYTFGGWYSDSGLTKKVTTIAKGSTGNKTLYAKWTVNKYNIAFNGNKSTSGSMKTLSSCKYGSSYTLTANAYKRTGYTFTGWNTKADGSGTAYKNKASVKNLTSTNGKTITLYTQWKKATYTITYNLNGGKNVRRNHYWSGRRRLCNGERNFTL